MTDGDKRPSEADAALQREIRHGRKFGPRELMAHVAGPGAMKGASAVSPVQQAEAEIGIWLRANLADSDGALTAVLQRHLKGSKLLFDNLDRPLVALAEYCRSLVAAEELLKEVVSEADIDWGRAMDERPHFERDGVPPHPDDPYTLEGVRTALGEALEELPAGRG